MCVCVLNIVKNSSRCEGVDVGQGGPTTINHGAFLWLFLWLCVVLDLVQELILIHYYFRKHNSPPSRFANLGHQKEYLEEDMYVI